jgi:hypothetical protein
MKSAQDPLQTDASPTSIPAPFTGFTAEAIAAVRDFTARKTLEQSLAFAQGLAEVLRPGQGGARAELAEMLLGVGIYRSDAEQLAIEGAALIALIADRERKAEQHEAAVRAAAAKERALYERLVSFARLLRLKLGPTAPALACFGVPPEPGAPPSRRMTTLRPPPLDAGASLAK